MAKAGDPGLAGERNLHRRQRSSHHSFLERRSSQRKRRIRATTTEPVGDPNSGPKGWNTWFHTAAFAPAAPGTFGNAGRNTVIDPPPTSQIFGHQVYQINERIRLQFRSGILQRLQPSKLALPNVTVKAPDSAPSPALLTWRMEIRSAMAVRDRYNSLLRWYSEPR